MDFSRFKIIPSGCGTCPVNCMPLSELFIQYLIVFGPAIIAYLCFSIGLYLNSINDKQDIIIKNVKKGKN